MSEEKRVMLRTNSVELLNNCQIFLFFNTIVGYGLISDIYSVYTVCVGS